MRIHCQVSSFVCQPAVMCEIQSCDDGVTEPGEEGEQNEWNQVLALLTHLECSLASQKCVQEEDLCKVALWTSSLCAESKKDISRVTC